MTVRLHVQAPLQRGAVLDLPPGAARHAQVLRLQPGSALVLFDGRGGEWDARVERMGRSAVRVAVGGHHEVERELALQVTIAIGMPANDRMDALVEKATELGAAAIQPLLCERSVLRLGGERAERKREHWQAVAIAACEQSGRTRVPPVHAVQALPDWLRRADLPPRRFVLSLGTDAAPLRSLHASAGAALAVLSGPEGGLTEAEEQAARAAGCQPLSLGPRTLRADTAPLMALAWLAAQEA